MLKPKLFFLVPGIAFLSIFGMEIASTEDFASDMRTNVDLGRRARLLAVQKKMSSEGKKELVELELSRILSSFPKGHGRMKGKAVTKSDLKVLRKYAEPTSEISVDALRGLSKKAAERQKEVQSRYDELGNKLLLNWAKRKLLIDEISDWKNKLIALRDPNKGEKLKGKRVRKKKKEKTEENSFIDFINEQLTQTQKALQGLDIEDHKLLRARVELEEVYFGLYLARQRNRAVKKEMKVRAKAEAEMPEPMDDDAALMFV